ncbi:MAG: hydroxymethylbilane synthase [Fuerstiella sp.]
MSEHVIRIATRSSKLALWQAEHVKSLIETTSPEFTVEIVHVKTVGDANQTDALREFGGTGVFTREVQHSVLQQETDIAVHSLKDLPTLESSGLKLAGVPDRAPHFDALLLPGGQTIESLDEIAEVARIGTGSPRRQTQLLNVRPDLQMLEIRGNVDTRIRKLDDGQFDAIILAEAGLRRLGLADRISMILAPPLVLPAVGQGAIGIECREDDERVQQVLAKLTNTDVLSAVTAERSLLAALRAGCHAPLGALTMLDGDNLGLQGVLLSLDGTTRLEATSQGHRNEAADLGIAVAEQLLSQGGDKLVEAF